MDRILENLSEIVAREVAGYNQTGYYKETGYFLADPEKQVYVVLATPHSDHPTEKNPAITVMAHIVNQLVIIDEDITDRPLYIELMRCGVPREQIILKYAGEKAPDDAVKAP